MIHFVTYNILQTNTGVTQMDRQTKGRTIRLMLNHTDTFYIEERHLIHIYKHLICKCKITFTFPFYLHNVSLFFVLTFYKDCWVSGMA